MENVKMYSMLVREGSCNICRLSDKFCCRHTSSAVVYNAAHQIAEPLAFEIALLFESLLQAGGDDDDDDMFASDDEKPAKRPAAAAADDERPAKRPAPAAPASGASAAAGDAPAAAAPARAPVDYASWPVKELRRFLTERGQVDF